MLLHELKGFKYGILYLTMLKTNGESSLYQIERTFDENYYFHIQYGESKGHNDLLCYSYRRKHFIFQSIIIFSVDKFVSSLSPK